MTEIFSIIFLLLSFNFVSSQLTCWRCDPCPEPHSNTSSLVSAASCTAAQPYCVKTTIRVNQEIQISKGCVESCTSSSSNYFGQGTFIDCCRTNYCNFSQRNQYTLWIYLICIYYFLFEKE